MKSFSRFRVAVVVLAAQAHHREQTTPPLLLAVAAQLPLGPPRLGLGFGARLLVVSKAEPVAGLGRSVLAPGSGMLRAAPSAGLATAAVYGASLTVAPPPVHVRAPRARRRANRRMCCGTRVSALFPKPLSWPHSSETVLRRECVGRKPILLREVVPLCRIFPGVRGIGAARDVGAEDPVLGIAEPQSCRSRLRSREKSLAGEVATMAWCPTMDSCARPARR